MANGFDDGDFRLRVRVRGRKPWAARRGGRR